MRALSAILFENGLPNLPISLIEPHRNQRGVWRVKFCYESNEPLSMECGQASNLVLCLQDLGEVDLANEIDDAIQRAQRYTSM